MATIRVLTGADVTPYRKLRLAGLLERPPAFGKPYEVEAALPLEAMATRLEPSAVGQTFGAFLDGELAGTLTIRRYEAVNEQHRAYLAGFYVTPSARGKGVGRSLLRTAIQHARDLGDVRLLNLTVVTGQHAALALYQSEGFQICGTDPEAFLCDGKYYDEYLMTLRLIAV